MTVSGYARKSMRQSLRQYWVTYTAMVIVAVIGVLAISGQTAGAIASNPNMFVSADNVFYAYVKGGEKISASFSKSVETEPSGLAAHDINVALEGPGLTTQTCTMPKNVAVGQGCGFADVIAPETGIYRLSFNLPSGAMPYPEVSPRVKWGGNLFSWNLTIKDGTVEKQGRVWSELYATRQPAPQAFLANPTYYYVSESGYIYRAAYKGYNGQISTFSADAVGIRFGEDCASVYQSVRVTDRKFSPTFGECGGSYKLFFESPAGDLPKTAKKWDEKTTWIIPSVSAPKVTDLQFESDKNGDTQSGKISFRLRNFVGQYSVDIDTTGDGGFSSREDVKIKRTMKAVNNDVQQIEFDGVDARGQVIAPSQKITIRINVEKVAEIHLVNADVEGRTDGLELTRINGDNAPSSRMCWNDTDLDPLENSSLQTSTLDGRDCPDSSAAKLHGWPYATGSWGDGRYIDDWAYATTKVEGVHTITYPDDSEAPSTAQRKNNVPLLLGTAAVTVAFVALVAVIVMKRRAHRKLQRQAQRNHHPTDFPGPGDPPRPLL